MTDLLIVATALLAAGIIGAALWAARRPAAVPAARQLVAERTGRAMPAHRPHRPAPEAPAQPGPRHRIADAHTGCLSATTVLARLNAEADALPNTRSSRKDRPTHA